MLTRPMPVRTRFAPSPTGFLHIGSARTALFNWAWARHSGGRFLLRIEDTDRERSTAESERGLIEGLEWLGLDWDEGIARQSERAELHAAAIEKLLASGHAYRCVCSAEELELRKQRTIAAGGKWTYDGRCREAAPGAGCGPHTVRLRVDPDSTLAWDDLVFGPSGQAGVEIGDRIIRRSDGGALYNLAVVVDDLDMGITHVIRGDDHRINTAFQVAIYRALGAPLPAFAHLPLIVGESGKKLSKRRDPVSIQHFREQGYLPEAMLSWLARMGWSHGEQEVFTRDEIARLFDLAEVGRTPGQANRSKLDWTNQQLLRTLAAGDLQSRVWPFLEAVAGHPVEARPSLLAYLELLRERSHTLVEMAQQARWLVVDEISYDAKAAKKHLKAGARPLLEGLVRELSALPRWDPESIEAAFERVRTANGDVGMGRLAQPVRVALTGTAASAGIFETVAAIEPERALARLRDALAALPAGGG